MDWPFSRLQGFSTQRDGVGRLNIHKQGGNPCVSRAAGISLQPVGFWPDHRRKKSKV
jgi:hypothetical protein